MKALLQERDQEHKWKDNQSALARSVELFLKYFNALARECHYAYRSQTPLIDIRPVHFRKSKINSSSASRLLLSNILPDAQKQKPTTQQAVVCN